jgi:NifU-like protein involved in Fe-S cluster formation
MFTKEVIKRFKNPNNAGDLKTFNGLGTAGDPGCSDVVEIKIQFLNNRIKNAKFKVFGCPGAVSTTDVFIDMIKGKTIEEALSIKEEDIARALGGLPVESMHCSHLPMEAFRNAKNDYGHPIKKERKKQ